LAVILLCNSSIKGKSRKYSDAEIDGTSAEEYKKAGSPYPSSVIEEALQEMA